MKSILLILTALLLGVFTIDAQELTPRYGDGDNACLQQLRNTLSPAFLKDLTDMLVFSGKGINQLGDFEACQTKDLDYITLNVGLVEEKFIIARIAICSPRE